MLRHSSFPILALIYLAFSCAFLIGASSLDRFLAQAFVPATRFHRQHQGEILCPRVVSRLTSTEPSAALDDQADNDDEEEDDEDISFLFEEETPATMTKVAVMKADDNLDPTEQVWRYAKKPLLRIGSKGATHAHGNSLRQLLEDHTVVKVKVNTKKFQNSVQQAYEVLNGLAIENGAPADIELIQLREGTNEIVFGMPGTLQKMKEGTFPPPVVVDDEEEEDDDEPSSKLTA